MPILIPFVPTFMFIPAIFWATCSNAAAPPDGLADEDPEAAAAPPDWPADGDPEAAAALAAAACSEVAAVEPVDSPDCGTATIII